MSEYFKYGLYVILFLVLIQSSMWCFNHINPWIGLAIPTSFILTITYFKTKKTK